MEAGVGAFIITTFAFQSNQALRVMKPCFLGSGWTLSADGKQRINLLFSFPSARSFFFCFIKLSLSCSTSFFPSYFLPPHPDEEESDRAA